MEARCSPAGRHWGREGGGGGGQSLSSPPLLLDLSPVSSLRFSPSVSSCGCFVFFLCLLLFCLFLFLLFLFLLFSLLFSLLSSTLLFCFLLLSPLFSRPLSLSPPLSLSSSLIKGFFCFFWLARFAYAGIFMSRKRLIWESLSRVYCFCQVFFRFVFISYFFL